MICPEPGTLMQSRRKIINASSCSKFEEIYHVAEYYIKHLFSVTSRYRNSNAQEQMRRQKVADIDRPTWMPDLPAIEGIDRKRCPNKAANIIKDPRHLTHTFFSLLPLGRIYRMLKPITSRYENSFVP